MEAVGEQFTELEEDSLVELNSMLTIEEGVIAARKLQCEDRSTGPKVSSALAQDDDEGDCKREFMVGFGTRYSSFGVYKVNF